MKTWQLVRFASRCATSVALVFAFTSWSAAQWSISAFHDDADVGISPLNVYTHAVDLGDPNSLPPNVNGVQFVQGGPGFFPGGVNGQNAILPFNDTALPGYTSGGSRDLITDFVYNDPFGYVRLDGLTPGVEYETRFYHRNWDQGGLPFNRSQDVRVNYDGGATPDDTIVFNADDPVSHVGGADNAVPTILSYRFTAGVTNVQYDFRQIGGGTYHLYAVTNQVVGGAPLPPDTRVPIPTIYNTGVDDFHVALPDGAVDPHYQMTLSSDPTYPGPDSYVVNTAWPIAPFGPWLANSPTSKWISARAEQDQTANPTFGNQPGVYVMATSFDMTGFLPDTAVIDMYVYSDNQVLDVVLNGAPLGLTAPSFSPGGGRYYQITGPFVDGLNTMDFIWENLPPNVNPAGFRVEMAGRAHPIPEPSSFVLVGLGLAMAAVGARRRLGKRVA
jgi:hypothetical protein